MRSMLGMRAPPGSGPAEKLSNLQQWDYMNQVMDDAVNHAAVRSKRRKGAALMQYANRVARAMAHRNVSALHRVPRGRPASKTSHRQHHRVVDLDGTSNNKHGEVGEAAAHGGSRTLDSTDEMTEQSVAQTGMSAKQSQDMKAEQRAETQLEKHASDESMGASAGVFDHSTAINSEESSLTHVSSSLRGTHPEAPALNAAMPLARATEMGSNQGSKPDDAQHSHQSSAQGQDAHRHSLSMKAPEADVAQGEHVEQTKSTGNPTERGKALLPTRQASEDQLKQNPLGVAKQTATGQKQPGGEVAGVHYREGEGEQQLAEKPAHGHKLAAGFVTRWTRAAHVLEANLTAKLEAEEAVLRNRELVTKQAAKAKKSWVKALAGSPSAAQVGDLLTKTEESAERAYEEERREVDTTAGEISRIKQFEVRLKQS